MQALETSARSADMGVKKHESFWVPRRGSWRTFCSCEGSAVDDCHGKQLSFGASATCHIPASDLVPCGWTSGFERETARPPLGSLDPLQPGGLFPKCFLLSWTPLFRSEGQTPQLFPQGSSQQGLWRPTGWQRQKPFMPGDWAAVGEYERFLFLRPCHTVFLSYSSFFPPFLSFPFLLFWSERLFWKTSWIVAQEKKKINWKDK